MKKLSAGQYVVREKTPPPGFLPDIDSEGNLHEYEFEVISNGKLKRGDGEATDTLSIDVVDYRSLFGNVEIVKTDEDGNRLDYENDRVEFEIYEWNQGLKDYITDDIGAVEYDEATKTFKNNSPLAVTAENLGKFKIVETHTKSGFSADYTKEFQIDWTDVDDTADENVTATKEFTFEAVNTRNALKVLKVDEAGNAITYNNDNPEEKATFILEEYYGDGDDYDSDAYGQQDIDEEAGETYDGEGDEDAGAVPKPRYTVTADTGEDGVAVFKEIPSGQYRLKELKAPSGYRLILDERYITVDEQGLIYETGKPEEKKGTYTMSVENPENGLKLIKYDSNKNPLAGVKFTIVRITDDPHIFDNKTKAEIDAYLEEDGNVLETRTATTDANGEAFFSHLADGNWWVKEAEVPGGYELCDVRRAFWVENGGVKNMFTDKLETILVWTIWNGESFPIKIELDKVDAKQNEDGSYKLLSGAEFSVWELDPTIEEFHDGYVLPKEPIAKLTETTPGHYEVTIPAEKVTQENQGVFLVKETKSPEGYYGEWHAIARGFEAEDHTVSFTIAKGNPVPNNKGGREFVLKKYDSSVTDDNREYPILLNGAEFDFWYGSENKEEATWIEHHVTGEEGSAFGCITLKDLKNDETYYFEETKAPKGYNRNPEVHFFVVDATGCINLTNEAQYIYPFGNEPDWRIILRAGGLGRKGIYVLGGVALGGMLLIAFFRRKKKKTV